MSSREQFEANYPVTYEIRLHWGEMDAFQHLNNVVYFRYFETIRMEYFEKMGIVGDGAVGIGPILATTECKFIYPLTYPDTVLAGASVVETGSDRFTMNYGIYSLKHQRLAAKGSGVIVSYDYTGQKKADLPAAWASIIAEIQG